MPSAASAPEIFGKFRLLNRIGEGGMGVVYRAEMDTSGAPQQVVVKRVRPELARDPSFARMMAQEARLGALMRHPCVVAVIEAGEIEGQLYLVLEYVDGYDVSQILDRAIRVGRATPIGVCCYLALQAAEALDYAHTLIDKAGQPIVVAHRDISPSNLMVTTDGAVKLLDFGIAKASERVEDERTRTGTVKGKLAYFSPEQAEGLPLDARSDLFSLGIVLMELLLQRRLFRGNGDFDTLRRVREAEVPRPSRLRDEIDPDLDALLLRLLDKKREARYQSAHELIGELSKLVLRYTETDGGGRQVTQAFLRDLEPIERRPASSANSIVVPPEIGDSTQQVDVRPLDLTDIAPPRADRKKRRGQEPRAAGPLTGEVTLHGSRAAPAKRAGVQPRWRAYLDSLPDGVKSFPQCTIKAAVVRNFNDFFGSPPMPDEAPAQLHDLLRNPPLVSAYVSGVLARVFFLAVGDVLRVDDDTFVERVYESNKQLLTSPMYSVLFAVMNVERLIRNAQSRWAAFHHGIKLTVSDSAKGQATGVFTWPPGFEHDLMLRMHMTGLRAGIEAVGARNVRTELRLIADGEAHGILRWDP